MLYNMMLLELNDEIYKLMLLKTNVKIHLLYYNIKLDLFKLNKIMYLLYIIL